jgi:hypothetical protein
MRGCAVLLTLSNKRRVGLLGDSAAVNIAWARAHASVLSVQLLASIPNWMSKVLLLRVTGTTPYLYRRSTHNLEKDFELVRRTTNDKTVNVICKTSVFGCEQRWILGDIQQQRTRRFVFWRSFVWVPASKRGNSHWGYRHSTQSVANKNWESIVTCVRFPWLWR